MLTGFLDRYNFCVLYVVRTVAYGFGTVLRYDLFLKISFFEIFVSSLFVTLHGVDMQENRIGRNSLIIQISMNTSIGRSSVPKAYRELLPHRKHKRCIDEGNTCSLRLMLPIFALFPFIPLSFLY